MVSADPQLRDLGSFRGIDVVSPAGFLDVLEKLDEAE